MDALQSVSSGLQHNDEPEDQDTPKTLGSGFVTSVLGEGGAAVVYEIWNPKLEIHRAVKLWRPNLSEKDLQRFETEIKITSKLDHSNIVEIHTVGEWNGLPYIEMERIDGFSLQQTLKTNGAMPPVVALAITVLVCRALLYAHQEEFSLYGRKRKGVIHCDIKPANIMITRSGIIKLMDFGIANPTNVSLHTDPDKVTGSLQYMAPEQIRSHQVDARTDIYAIGVVLYEMLSGTKAFPSRQLLEVIEKRKTNDHVPLSQFCVNLPRRIYRLVTTCMELRPEDRYQNVGELMKTLMMIYKKLSFEDPQEVIQRYIETGTVPVRKIRISRQMMVPIVAGVVPTVLLIAAVGFFIFNAHRPGDNPPPAVSRHQKAVQTISERPDRPAVTAAAAPAQATSPVPVPAEKPSLVPVQHRTTKTVPPAAPPPVRKKSPAASAADPLAVLEALVDGGNLSAAIRRFEAKTINDGAYYSLYARCLYESGEWKKAYEAAEMSTRVPSGRITERSRMGQFLLYKARYLSARYDATPSRDAAQSAIDAWWKVREHFDGTSESAKATFAESEIGRISKILND
ncbi:MAG: serine/threonine protein kinase [Chitinispirillaceae bacterium]|nr:serine/threonine protein kinase [Chitinispirillaceae bacterium]